MPLGGGTPGKRSHSPEMADWETFLRRGPEAVERRNALIVGDDKAVGEMIDACRRGPSMARVDNVDIEPVDLDVLPQGFTQLPTA